MDNADYMMFTSSTATGRRIASDAGRRLIGASLELGGKNPMIVLDNADTEKAAEGAVACFPSAGQLCVSVERLYVAESIRDAFTAAFTARTEKLTFGAAYDYSMDVGSLTTTSQLTTVTEHVGDAVAKGATALADGQARPALGPLFHEPIVLTGVTPDMTLYDHETFGPVVSISTYRDVDEAVALANATSYGLNASVWSRDGARGRAVAARVHAGTVNEAFVHRAPDRRPPTPPGLLSSVPHLPRDLGRPADRRAQGHEGDRHALNNYSDSDCPASRRGSGSGREVPAPPEKRCRNRSQTASVSSSFAIT